MVMTISHRLLLFALIVTLLFSFTPCSAFGAANPTLEKALKDCQASRDKLRERIKRECPTIDQLSRQCKDKDLVAFLQEIRRNPPLSYRTAYNQYQEKFNECDQLQTSLINREQLVTRNGGNPANDSQYLSLEKKHQLCIQERVRLLGKLEEAAVAWDKRILQQRAEFNQCKKNLAHCDSLNDQFVSVATACDDLARELEAVKGGKPSSDDPIPGTLHTFYVECFPSKVQAGGTVSCTAHGIYSSNISNRLNLTHDPYTRWQSSLSGQSGPVLSTKGLRPGQSFTVKASRGSISDSATVTVIEKRGGDQQGEGGDDSMQFSNPMYKGMRLDVCLTYGSDCGQPAADAFCRSKDYSYAQSFKQQVVGTSVKTKIMGDESVCSGKEYCTAFSYIVCSGKKK